MHRCFVEKKELDDFLCQKQSLPKEVVFRFSRIVRVKNQEKVALFDGEGRQVQGTWNTSLNTVENLVTKQQAPLTPKVILYQAVLKDSKNQEVVQKATEFGVDEIIFFEGQHTLSGKFAKEFLRKERLENTSIDASRQSGRFYVPNLSFDKHALANLDCKDDTVIIFGDLESRQNMWEVLLKTPKVACISLVVGPEGGLSSQEIKVLKEKKACGVLWAPYVLRAETASLAPISLINNHFLTRGKAFD